MDPMQVILWAFAVLAVVTCSAISVVILMVAKEAWNNTQRRK